MHERKIMKISGSDNNSDASCLVHADDNDHEHDNG